MVTAAQATVVANAQAAHAATLAATGHSYTGFTQYALAHALALIDFANGTPALAGHVWVARHLRNKAQWQAQRAQAAQAKAQAKHAAQAALGAATVAALFATPTPAASKPTKRG